MVIDGRAVAADIIESVRLSILQLQSAPRLTVFTCAPNFETEKFLSIKKQKAKEVGVSLQVVEFKIDETQAEIIQSIKAAHETADGIIVQLPFPSDINIDAVLPSVASSHDVDGISYGGGSVPMFPPVVGAIAELSHRYQVDFEHKHVVIVGQGRLVGIPAASYAQSCGARVTVVTKENGVDLATATRSADIIITGAGVPGLVTPDMISNGVIVFDAGTSEDGGELVGDVAVACQHKAALFTPVPGGIGPITVAVLLRNVTYAAK